MPHRSSYSRKINRLKRPSVREWAKGREDKTVLRNRTKAKRQWERDA